jgi:hypothetical protein
MCTLFTLALGPCAVACGLTAINGDACCSVDTGDDPCCPDEPAPVCQCDLIDEQALPPDLLEMLVAIPTQIPALTAVRKPMTTNVVLLSQESARAPPGLVALRCIVLVI